MRRFFKILALCVFGPLALLIMYHVIKLSTDPEYLRRFEQHQKEAAERRNGKRAQREKEQHEAAQRRAQREKAEAAQRQREKFAKEHDTTSAYVMSKKFIRNQLKAPSTADFPWAGSDDVNVVKSGDAKYIVSTYVDAQNSFGAKLRSKWLCEVEYVGDDNWRATPGMCGLLGR